MGIRFVWHIDADIKRISKDVLHPLLIKASQKVILKFIDESTNNKHGIKHKDLPNVSSLANVEGLAYQFGGMVSSLQVDDISDIHKRLYCNKNLLPKGYDYVSYWELHKKYRRYSWILALLKSQSDISVVFRGAEVRIVKNR